MFNTVAIKKLVWTQSRLNLQMQNPGWQRSHCRCFLMWRHSYFSAPHLTKMFYHLQTLPFPKCLCFINYPGPVLWRCIGGERSCCSFPAVEAGRGWGLKVPGDVTQSPTAGLHSQEALRSRACPPPSSWASDGGPWKGACEGPLMLPAFGVSGCPKSTWCSYSESVKALADSLPLPYLCGNQASPRSRALQSLKCSHIFSFHGGAHPGMCYAQVPPTLKRRSHKSLPITCSLTICQ